MYRFLLFLMLFISCSPLKNKEIATTSPPNILLFLVDDMGWQDTSVPFWKQRTPLNDIYHTPNMERLASQGMKFTQAYAASVCSPSRISLMTGTNPARHRVTNWTLHYNAPTDHTDNQLQYPSWNYNGLANTPDIPNTFYATPLPELLQQAGYYTIHIGKAHFAATQTPCANPLNMGFDVNVAGHAAGGLQSYEGMDNFGNIPQKANIFAIPDLDEFHGKDIFATEALTLKAIEALENRPKNRPFFLYMSHYAIHIPIMGDKRFLNKYLDKGMNETEAKYASLIEGMDKSLGDLMNYIEKNKLDNTVIIFISDNGGLDVSNRGLSQNTCNAPLASGKGSLLEGGVRVPMLAMWKNKIKPKSIVNKPVIIEDLFPTLVAISGNKQGKIRQEIDGKNLLPTFLGEKTSNEESSRALFWHLPNKWLPTNQELGISPASAVREGDYKLIYYHNTQQIRLYNLAEDIGEVHDISTKNPSKAKYLAEILSNYLRKVDAQMPTDKNNGKVVPLPDEIGF